MSDEEKFSSEEWQAKMDEGGWVDSLPEETANRASAAKFLKGPVSKILDSYDNLEKGFGDKVPKAKSTFTKDEWAEWNSKYNTGFPEELKDYKLGRPEGADEKFPYSEEEETAFRQFAHDNGLTATQAERLWADRNTKALEGWNTQRENWSGLVKKDKEDLKKDWGAAFDGKMKLARQVLQQYADKEFVESLAKQHIRPNVWKMLSNIGENLKEGKLEDISSSSSDVYSPKEAQIKAREYMEKHKKAYLNAQDPMHDEVVKKVEEFFKMAYPEESR